MADGDDFVIVRSKRQKRPTLKQKLFEDSEDSEDEFIPPSKRSKSQSKSKKKGSTIEAPGQHTKDSRLSIDETIFNRNTALAMALSVNTAPSPTHDTSLCSNSPKQSQQVGGACPDDSDDYRPEENNPSESESDKDFEPSPQKSKKLLNPKTVRKARKGNVRSVVAEKVNVRKGDVSTVKSVDPPPAIATSPRDLPGTTSPRDIPGTKPSVTATSLPGTKSATGRRGSSNTGTPVKGGSVRASVGHSRPKWTPPGPAKVGKDARNCTVPQVRNCSNNGPVIRVGLSRKAPIKPLHTLPSPLQTKN